MNGSLSPDLVMTEAAKDLLRRPVFPAIGRVRPKPLGDHIAVNGHDLARVEAEAFARGQASAPKAHTKQQAAEDREP